jgi:hypothetical protein
VRGFVPVLPQQTAGLLVLELVVELVDLELRGGPERLSGQGAALLEDVR